MDLCPCKFAYHEYFIIFLHCIIINRNPLRVAYGTLRNRDTYAELSYTRHKEKHRLENMLANMPQITDKFCHTSTACS